MPLPLRFLHILNAASDHCLINSKIDCQGSCHTHATSRASKEVRSSLFCIHKRKKRGHFGTYLRGRRPALSFHASASYWNETSKTSSFSKWDPNKVLVGNYAWSQTRLELLQGAEAWRKEKMSMKRQEQLFSAGFLYRAKKQLQKSIPRTSPSVGLVPLDKAFWILRSVPAGSAQSSPGQVLQISNFAKFCFESKPFNWVVQEWSQLYGNTVPSYPVCAL